MARVTQNTLTITKNAANAAINVDYRVRFDDFDRVTNVPYEVAVQLMGDDSPEDGFGGTYPDHLLDSPPRQVDVVAADGRDYVDFNWSPDEIPWTDLDEDSPLFGLDEIRALVTATPQLPAQIERESNLVAIQVP